MNYLIQDTQIAWLVKYLKKQTYDDVAEGIMMLSRLQQYEQTQPVENKKNKTDKK